MRFLILFICFFLTGLLLPVAYTAFSGIGKVTANDIIEISSQDVRVQEDRFEEQLPFTWQFGIERIITTAVPVETGKSNETNEKRILPAQLRIEWAQDILPIRLSIPTDSIRITNNGNCWKSVFSAGELSLAVLHEKSIAELNLNLVKTDEADDAANLDRFTLNALLGLQQEVLTVEGIVPRCPGPSEKNSFTKGDFINEFLQSPAERYQPYIIQANELTVTLLDFVQNREQLILIVKIEYAKSGEAFESYQNWIIRQPYLLYDEKGNRLIPVKIKQSARNHRGAILQLEYRLPDSIAKEKRSSYTWSGELPTLIDGLSIQYTNKQGRRNSSRFSPERASVDSRAEKPADNQPEEQPVAPPSVVDY